MHHLAATAALGAGLGGGAGLGARAAALVAGGPAAVAHLLGDAGGGLLQRQLDRGLDVGAGARAARAPPNMSPKMSEKAEKTSPTSRKPPPPPRSRAGVAETVVEGALLRVGQHLVGLGRLLETPLGLLVAGVAVGVELHRQLAVGLLQLGRVGASRATPALRSSRAFHSPAFNV